MVLGEYIRDPNIITSTNRKLEGMSTRKGTVKFLNDILRDVGEKVRKLEFVTASRELTIPDARCYASQRDQVRSG